jgi:hypothetical protein
MKAQNVGRILGSALVLVLLLWPTTTLAKGTCTPTSRKGVGAAVVATNANAIDKLNIHWYYDWSPDNYWYKGYTGSAIYVPEFWNASSTFLMPISGNSPWVFTFNEPDVSNQSDMTVAEAIDAWPTVEADSDGKLIGAPDIAGSLVSGGGSWLSAFMSDASSDGYTVNFLALHVYPDGNGTTTAQQVSSFEAYITSVHDAYPSYPIVVNEFSLVNRSSWNGTNITPAEQVAFINAVVPWLESQSYIIGYSWFEAYDGGYGSDLLSSSGTLSAIGTAYSSVGCVGTSTVPTAPATNPATYITSSGFTANWTAPSGANQYILYLFNTSWQELGVYYLGNVNSYPISGLAANTAYEYCVTSGNSAGFSNCGNSTLATSDSPGGTIPSAPTTEAATAITSSGYTAHWTASPGATQYIVYEFNSSWGELEAFSLGNVTSYAVTGQAANTSYYYCVVGGNSAGYSSCANSVAVTTN